MPSSFFRNKLSIGYRARGRRRLPLLLEALEDRTVPSTVNWIAPGNGNFDNPANWSTGTVPGAGDDAVISTSSPATVSVQVGDNLSVHSLTTGAIDTLAIRGGSLALGSDSILRGGFFNEGSLSVNGGTLQLEGGSSSSGSLSVAASATLLFPGFNTNNTFRFGATLGGAGTVELDPQTQAEFATGSTYAVSGTTNLAGGVLVLDGSASLGSLSESGGELSGAAAVTVTGTTTWNGGTMSGAGSTDARGGLAFGASDGSARNEVLAGRTLINEGIAVWYDQNTLVQLDSSTLVNRPNATLTINGGSWGFNSAAPDTTGLVDNRGTLTVAAGSTETVQAPSIAGTGKVQVSSGTLAVNGTSTITGTFTVATGATLVFDPTQYLSFVFDSGASISGTGTVRFGSETAATFAAGSSYDVTGTTVIANGSAADSNVVFSAGSSVQAVGNLTIQSGAVNFSTGSTITVPSLNESSGTLTGSDTVVVSGQTTWTGGTMSGTGTTQAAGTLALGSSGGANQSELLAVRTFINAGQATWLGSGDLTISFGAVFVNQAGATFSEQTGNAIHTNVGFGQDPSGTFVNQGSFVVAGGQTTMEPFFDNSGSVEIQSGTWSLTGNGSATGGKFIVDQGATFDLNKNYALGSATITGPGIVNLIGGSNDSPVAFTGGLIPVPNGASFFDVRGNVTVSSLNMTGGFLIVDGTLTVTGATVWTGGYIVGPGQIIAQGGLQIGASGQQYLYGTTLVNAGPGTLSGNARIDMDYGSALVNQQGATLTIQGGGDGLHTDGTVTLLNQGGITAAIGMGSTWDTGFATLINSGSLTVTSGNLALDGAGTATGSFSVQAGGSLTIEHGPLVLGSGASVSGAGTVLFGSSDWASTFDGGSTYNVSGSTTIDGGLVLFDPGSQALNLGSLAFSTAIGTFLGSRSGSPVSVAALTQPGGALGGPDTVTVSGPTTWTGGAMTGTGRTVAQGGLQLGTGGSNQEFLLARTLVNPVSTIFETGDTLQQESGSLFENLAGASVTLQDGTTWNSPGNGTGAVDNQGTANFAGTSATVSVALNNSGNVQVPAGTLSLQGGGVGGTYTIDAGATLSVGYPNPVAITATSVTFPGDFIFSDLGGTFSGTASDTSGTGLASVGVSLFDGSHYFDGTAFESSTAVFLPATLAGTNWSLTVPLTDFSPGVKYTVASQALSTSGSADSSTITDLVLSEQASTTTTLSTSAASAVFGQAVTFTATVTSAGGTPTGTVKFEDGSTTLGAVGLDSNGVATFSTSHLSIAGHTITAVYSGDRNFQSSTSAALSQTVNKADTIVALTAGPNPSVFGQSVTFTATVGAASPGTGTPTGTVTFEEGGNTLGTGTLDGSGAATFSTSSLSAGRHTVTAVYAGDSHFNGRTAQALDQVVNQAGSTVALTSDINPSTFGQTVTFKATVTGPASTPTGTVTFEEGNATLGTGTLDGSGVATFSTSSLSGGTHSVTAVYAGDSNFSGSSTGQPLAQVVNQAGSTTVLTSDINPSTLGRPVTLTATVTSPAGTPTGTVTFEEGSTLLGTQTLNNGVATLTLGTLGLGSHALTAVYSGDSNFSAGTPGTLTQNVVPITLSPATLPTTQVGASYQQTLSASGGTAPYTFTLASGTLPSGLQLSPAGALTGQPTAAGSFTFSVTATDSSASPGPFSGTQTYTVNVVAITLGPSSLPPTQVGASYNQALSASGGTAGYTFTLTGGTLPAGLQLSPGGVLSGQPTAAGSYTFRVTATDSSASPGPFTGSQTYTVNVVAVTLGPTTLPILQVGASYQQALTASGGAAPYTFRLTGGMLPAGVKLSPAGILSGQPTTVGSFTFTVTATDSSGSPGPFSGSKTYTVKVVSITLAPISLPGTQAGASYRLTLTATGGTGPYTYKVTSGTLPTGLALSGAGVLSGTPTKSGTFTFTVQATDKNGNTGTHTWKVTVLPGVAARVAFVSQPNGPVAVNHFLAPFAVGVLDKFGNRVNALVSLTLVVVKPGLHAGAGPGSVTQVATADGVATFRKVSINVKGTYRLVAHVGALSVASNAFTVG